MPKLNKTQKQLQTVRNHLKKMLVGLAQAAQTAEQTGDTESLLEIAAWLDSLKPVREMLDGDLNAKKLAIANKLLKPNTELN